MLNVQLAENFYEHQEFIKSDFTITLKIDGIRCIAVKEDKQITFYTRQGKVIEGLDHIREDLSFMEEDFVLDGELVVSNYKKLESKEAYKRTSSIVRTENNDKSDLIFVLFDYPSVRYPFEYRRRLLERLVVNRKYVTVVPKLYDGKDISKVQYYLNKVRSEGLEGLMINVNSAYYKEGRTKNLLKVKVMKDCDLVIIGMTEGMGKYKNSLGAFLCSYKGNVVKVGSGFTAEQRGIFWANQDGLIGRVAKVQYFEETSNSKGFKSLRFPIFIEFCPEGKEPSYY